MLPLPASLDTLQVVSFECLTLVGTCPLGSMRENLLDLTV